MSIDTKLNFLPVNIAIITISDTRSISNDKSGDLLEERVKSSGHNLIFRDIVKDDFKDITSLVTNLTNQEDIDIIITTGGTGLTGRDITPEVMKSLFEKSIDGFGELFRWLSYSKIGTSAMQSRALAGVSNGTYIFCLPGSPSACKDGWDNILIYQLDIRNKPCNFIEIIPRLKEHESYRNKN
jgi:molybdenum cofactor biosynthesis protein B